MLRKISLTLVAIALSGFAAIALADGIRTHGTYVYIDTSVRSITLEGMRDRLALLRSGEATPAAEQALDDKVRKRITEFYRSFGTTASEHAAYGSRHAEALVQWVEAHPDWQQSYMTLQADFEAVSAKLSVLRTGQ